MAHVVVLESADATCDVLCLAKQAKGDLNKVYLRQNNGKPRTKSRERGGRGEERRSQFIGSALE